MSTTIDQRVVEMRFDNSQFEKNISQSTESLEKLKESLKLDNCAKAFDTIERAAKGLDLSSITTSVQTVSTSFNALESIANGVLQRLGWNIEASISRFIHSFSQFTLFGQAGLGWTKYGELTQSTQTIVAAGYAIEDVEHALERLNWYTDETSYNFTDMANNIGKFTAQGVDLEVAATAMQGISNWAARSGQTASEAGRAMYNLSQALSMGALTNMDWKSIENANMATKEFKQTAIETGLALGTLVEENGKYYTNTKKYMEVNENTFRNTLSEKWLDDKVLLGTLEKYGAATNELYAIGSRTGLTATQMLQALDSYQKGTKEWEYILKKNGSGYVSAENFGNMLSNLGREENKLGLASFRMAQEALTFKQAMDAVSDAASTTWMNIFNKLFGTFEDARGLWTNVANDFYDIFVEPVNEMLDFVTRNFDSGLDQIGSMLSSAGVDKQVFENLIIDQAKAKGMFSQSMLEALENGSATIYDFFSGKAGLERSWMWNEDFMVGVIESIVDEAGEGTVVLENLGDVARRVILGDFGNGANRVKALTEAGYEYATVQDAVNKLLNGQSVEDVIQVNGQTLSDLGLTADQIQQIKDYLDESTESGESFAEALSKLRRRSNRDLLAEGIHKSLMGIANVGSIVRDVFSSLFDGIGSNALGSIIEGFNNLSNKFYEFTNTILESEDSISIISAAFNGLIGIFRAIGGVIRSIASSVWKAVKSLLPFGEGVVTIKGVLKSLAEIFEDVSDWISGVSKKIMESTFIGDIVNGIAAAFNILYLNVVNAWNFIDSHLPKGDGIFKRLGQAVKDWYASFKEDPKVQKYFGWLIEAGEKLVEKLPGFFDTVSQEFDKFITYMDEKTDGGTNILGGMVSILGDLKTAIIGLFNFSEVDLRTFFGENLQSFSGDFATAITRAFEGIVGATGEKGKWYADVTNALDNAFKVFGDATNGDDSWWRIRGWAEGVDEKIKPVIDELEKLDLKKLTTVVAAGGLTAAVVRIATGFERIGEAVKNFSNPFNEIKNILVEVKNIAKIMKAQIAVRTFTLIAVGILAISVAVVILFAAVYVLSKNVESIKDLSVGLIALGIVMAFIVGFYVAVSAANKKFGGPENAMSVVAIVVSISFAVLILIGALELLKLVNPSMGTIGKLGLIMLEMAIFTQFVGGIRIDKAIGAVVLLIGFSGFLLIFAFSLWALDRTLGMLKNPGIMISILVVMVIGIVAFSFLLKRYSAIIWSSVATMLAIPVSLLIMAFAFKEILAVPWKDLLAQVYVIIVAIEIVLGMMVAASFVKGKASITAAASTVLLAAAVLIIAYALKMVSEIKLGWRKLIFNMSFLLIALSILSLAAVFLARSTEGADAIKAAIGATAMAGALLIIVGAMALMTLLDVNKLRSSAFTLGIIILALSAAIKATRGASNQTGTILALAALITVLVLSFAILQNIFFRDIWTKVLLMAGLLLVIGAMIAIAGHWGNNSWLPLLTAVMMVAVLAGAFYLLQRTGIKKAWNAVAQMASIIVLLAGLMVIADKFGSGSFLPILASALLLAAIARALALLSNVGDADSISKLTGSIMGVIVALGAMIWIIGKVGASAVFPLLALTAVFIGLGAGLYLASIGIEKFIASLSSLSIEQVAELGIKIGAIIPNIIAGLMVGMEQALPVIGGVLLNGLKSAFLALLGFIPVAWEKGKQLVSAIWEGIKNFDWEAIGQWILNALKNVLHAAMTGAVKSIKSFDAGQAYQQHYENEQNAGAEASAAYAKGVSGSFDSNVLAEEIYGQAPAAAEASAEVGTETGDIQVQSYMEELMNADGDISTGWSSMVSGIDLSSLTGMSDDAMSSFQNGSFNPTAMKDFFGQTGSAGVEGFNAAAGPEVWDGVCENIIGAIKKRINYDAGLESGTSLGKGMVDGARRATEVNSPSRKFYEIGEYCVKGLVNAVQHLSGTAADAGYDLGINVLTATSESLAGMYAILEGEEMIMPSVGLVSSPTSFQNGINAGNGLNGGTYAFGSAGYSKGAGASSNSVTTNNPVFNIYQQPNQSPEDLAAIINRELGRLYV